MKKAETSHVETVENQPAEETAPEETSHVETVRCKVCGREFPHPISPVHIALHGMTELEYEQFNPDAEYYEGVIQRLVERVEKRAEPLPEEETIKIVLRDLEENPYSCTVEGRPYMVYYFVKGKPQAIPKPDARILCGSPPEWAGRYSWLRFWPANKRDRKQSI